MNCVFFVEESGKVYAFGDNTWGQLGLGHCKPVRKPIRIKGKYAHYVVFSVNNKYRIGYGSIKGLCLLFMTNTCH